MAILKVLHFPDERLRLKGVTIEEIDSEIASLAENMLETMYLEGGIGLAATQVNIDLSENKDDPLILTNPKISKLEGKEITQEGCLSVPEYFDNVERAKNIEYNYETLNKKTIVAKAEGLLAICIQQEIDHLDGKLFIDYLSPLKRNRLRKKINKQKIDLARSDNFKSIPERNGPFNKIL